MSPITKRVTYLLRVPQVAQLLCPNRLNTHRVPTIGPFPDVRESSARVVRGTVVTQFNIGENPGSTEEGVGIEPERRV